MSLYGTTGFVAASEGHDRPSYDPCERVAIFLRRMGHGTSVRTTCVAFQVAEETAERVTMEVAHRVIFKLSREYVPWPTVEEQAEIARVWELEKNLR